jgi:allantoate deiminase/N-carbamoyl-L-amino-acid hydrolase
MPAAPSSSSLPPPGTFGTRIVEAVDQLARWSDSAEGLSCTYLRPAHCAVARELAKRMADAGLAAHIDGVGNVVGRLPGAPAGSRTLIVGSHYDTVHNAGRYDGRLGILTGLVVAEHLARTGAALPFGLEVIGFAEEEGVRFPLPYIGSAPLAGRFDARWLGRLDATGVTLADAMLAAGLDPAAIARLARDRASLVAYLEVHIEQGPVLLHQNLPVGIVSSIAGAARYAVTVTGEAGHAGTVPMALRRDALAAAAEIILLIERRCAAVPRLVGTVGRLDVADEAANVVAGRCDLSLDIRSADDAVRDAAIADIMAGIEEIARRRGIAARNACAPASPARSKRAE